MHCSINVEEGARSPWPLAFQYAIDLNDNAHPRRPRGGDIVLKSVKSLDGYKLAGLDIEVGKVKEFYFDDHFWTIRYLVAVRGIGSRAGACRSLPMH